MFQRSIGIAEKPAIVQKGAPRLAIGRGDITVLMSIESFQDCGFASCNFGGDPGEHGTSTRPSKSGICQATKQTMICSAPRGGRQAEINKEKTSASWYVTSRHNSVVVCAR